MHAFVAEHRRRLFPDEMFADLFPSDRGRPSVPADVVATVMVLQALEGRSDREACRVLQTDIAWKAAAGLALTDEAFHPYWDMACILENGPSFWTRGQVAASEPYLARAVAAQGPLPPPPEANLRRLPRP